MRKRKQKIIPNLWFSHQAEEAVKFYTSVFTNSEIHRSTKYMEAGQEIHQMEPGSVMTVEFEMEGLKIVALNGGPHFKFNPSVSLFVLCKTAEETESLWQKLSEGGKILIPLDSYDWSPKYAWVQDKYGLSWQLMLEEEEDFNQKIVPLLFFTGKIHGKAEEAIRFYNSMFKDAEIQGILNYGPENSYANGSIMHAQFLLEGETYMAMDSGMENDFPFNEAVSFIITCKDQEEIDYYWDKLTAGGDPNAQQCGWLKDKYGVSWQVIPQGMEEILGNPEREKANRGMEAVMHMKKFDLEVLREATR
ncbi:VOC family protein [Antarcticibacterium sp. 1MA-6-2]|uniref:VOC family protein n=1 Tax=Antarcticibacterium sp. 1MA-6-2 TaxID=2908210 RepID=UPI001F266ED5|nr:VOC family protein [Antarcticibacterium sp. 1MA-6-2]UJH92345.1 VOC family protein [Antarcticibacterium sp. 1MA-6-2]